MKKNITVLVLVSLCVIFSFYLISTTYPLDKKPDSYWSAIFLANTVIDDSSCSNLESMDELQKGVFLFSCEKEGKKLKSSYTIYVFSDLLMRNIFFKKIENKMIIFKSGKYFLVVEDIFYGSSKSNDPKPITIDSYRGFSGEIIIPKSTQ